jgi:alkylhydroperoxidase family enzyme
VQQLGYTEAQIAEIFMVVGLFNHTNILMHGLRLDETGRSHSAPPA